MSKRGKSRNWACRRPLFLLSATNLSVRFFASAPACRIGFLGWRLGNGRSIIGPNRWSNAATDFLHGLLIPSRLGQSPM